MTDRDDIVRIIDYNSDRADENYPLLVGKVGRIVDKVTRVQLQFEDGQTAWVNEGHIQCVPVSETPTGLKEVLALLPKYDIYRDPQRNRYLTLNIEILQEESDSYLVSLPKGMSIEDLPSEISVDYYKKRLILDNVVIAYLYHGLTRASYIDWVHSNVCSFCSSKKDCEYRNLVYGTEYVFRSSCFKGGIK